ncbi:MAG TPA: Phenylacetic acid catabolic protein, partial [Methylomirabilota bacterium]|nr:Phenylacetic acid catabolic protein [Methylomirabilota bacterium]
VLKLLYALASTEFASVEQHQPWINRGPTRLCGARPEDAQRAVDKWYPRALDTFGKSQSRFSDLAVAYGIRRWGNAELREMYRQDIDAQILDLGLAVPPANRGRRVL